MWSKSSSDGYALSRFSSFAYQFGVIARPPLELTASATSCCVRRTWRRQDLSSAPRPGCLRSASSDTWSTLLDQGVLCWSNELDRRENSRYGSRTTSSTSARSPSLSSARCGSPTTATTIRCRPASAPSPSAASPTTPRRSPSPGASTAGSSSRCGSARRSGCSSAGIHWRPNALKVAVGKVNAVSGQPWSERLKPEDRDGNQDYLVVPEQPWLDGINSGDGTIRQFVAMPLGDGLHRRGAGHRRGAPRRRAAVRVRAEARQVQEARSAPAVASQRARIVAQATLRALGELLGSTAEVESAAVHVHGEHLVAVTLLAVMAPRTGAQLVSGSAVVRGDEADAVARSVLDALNRRLSG